MSIKKNFFYNSLNQIVFIILPIITVPYISRVLGPKNIGIYSYSYSIAYYFVMFIMLGLSNYGNREISRVKDDKNELNKMFSSIYYMQFVIGISVLILYFLLVYMFVKENNIIFYIQGIYVLSSVIDINWLLYGLEKFKVVSIRNILIKIISFSFILLLVNDKSDLIVYTIILSLETLFTQLFAWSYVLHNLKLVKVKISNIAYHLKPNLVLFIPVIAVSLYKIMDKIMLGYICNVTQVGYYESSEKIIKIPLALITSLGIVMLPRMSNILANGKENELLSKQYLKNSMMLVFFLSSSLVFGILSVSQEFIPIFYGEGYDICYILYLFLLPSCIFVAFSSVIRTQFLIPRKKDLIYIKAVITGAIVNIVINSIFIPYYKSVGAAVGTLCAEIVVCLYQAWHVKNDLPIKEYIIENSGFVIAGLIMYVVLLNFPTGSNLMQVLVHKILIGAVIYIILCFIFYHRKMFELIKNTKKNAN